MLIKINLPTRSAKLKIACHSETGNLVFKPFYERFGFPARVSGTGILYTPLTRYCRTCYTTMAPLANTTVVCNNTLSACAKALDRLQERYENAQRLSEILGALLGVVALLFICSPLIFNLPRNRDDNFETSRAPPPPPKDHNYGIEMQNLEENREIPDPEQFVIGGEESPDASQSTLPDPSRFREVEVDGEVFHINKSDATLLAETGVFRGAGDEQDLARRCVEEEPRASSVAGEGEDEATPREERVGTAV